MAPRSSADLLAALRQRTEENLRFAESLAALPTATLHLRPRPDAWNALECLAHLNFYGRYYLPEVRRQMEKTKHRGGRETFTSSRLGNYFAAGMKPRENMKPFTAPKSSNPAKTELPVDETTIAEFISQQKDILNLLDLAAGVDLTRTKTGTSLSKLIRLRLGDTLRVVVYHNWRHVVQAQRALQAAQ